MSGESRSKRRFNWAVALRKVVVLLILGWLLSYGVYVYTKPDFDYSKVNLVEKDGVIQVGFDFLSGFNVDTEPVPEKVKALHGRRVALSGYMLPLDFDEGGVSAFFLVRNRRGCCIDITPRLNELVYVRVAGGGTAKLKGDSPLKIQGTFWVGAGDLENGLYTVEAEGVEKIDEGPRGIKSLF